MIKRLWGREEQTLDYRKKYPFETMQFLVGLMGLTGLMGFIWLTGLIGLTGLTGLMGLMGLTQGFSNFLYCDPF